MDKSTSVIEITQTKGGGTVWVVYLFFAIAYILVTCQFLMYFLATRHVDMLKIILGEIGSLDLSHVSELRELVPNFAIEQFITGLGWITGGYLGIDHVYSISKSAQLPRGKIIDNSSKQSSYIKIMMLWLGLLVFSAIAQLLVGYTFQIPLEATVFWCMLIATEYVVGRKAVKASSTFGPDLSKVDIKKEEIITEEEPKKEPITTKKTKKTNTVNENR